MTNAIISLKDYKALKFDSVEEYIVFLYLTELKEKKFIREIICQPMSFTLFDGLEKKFFKYVKLKSKTRKDYRKRQHLINPHIYTADFKILWNEIWQTRTIRMDQSIHSAEYEEKFPFLSCYDKSTSPRFSYLEVKPKYDKHNMTRLFTSRTQPWIWQKHNRFIQLIKPYELMKKTFVPDNIRHEMYYKTNTKKAKKGDPKFSWEYKTLEEYLNNRINK